MDVGFSTMAKWIQKSKPIDLPSSPASSLCSAGVEQENSPWIFRVVTPEGEEMRTAVRNGPRNCENEFPEDIIRSLGGDRIAIVQVHSPVGVDLRSSLHLTTCLSKNQHGIILWVRDIETFQSILKSFVRLDLETVSPPDLPRRFLMVKKFPTSLMKLGQPPLQRLSQKTVPFCT